MKTSLMVAAILLSLAGSGKPLTWKQGSTDWSKAESFVENEAPASGDTVVIPDNVTAVVLDANSESWQSFASLGVVCFRGKNSKLEITVGSSDGVPHEREVSCSVRYLKSDGSFDTKNYKTYGEVIKKGPGLVWFTTPDEYVLGTCLTIEEGVVKLPREYETHVHCRMGITTVRERGTLIAAFPTGDRYSNYAGKTYVHQLWGSGVVTNLLSSQHFVVEDTKETSVFSGMIAVCRWASTGAVDLTGDNNYLVSPITASTGITGVRFFGERGSSSVADNSSYLYFEDQATWRYIGASAAVCKNRFVFRDSAGDFTFDAGPHGEVTVSTTIQTDKASKNKGEHRFFLAGSNAVESVFASQVSENEDSEGNVLPILLGKRGSGIWRMTGVRQWGGEVDIEGGTLRCETLANKGTDCSLGSATTVLRGYAWKFGSAKEHGTLDYVGDDDIQIEDREAVVTGLGGTLANSGSGTLGYIAGVKPLAGSDSVFGLGGSSMAENIVRNISDGDGGERMSLVKEGSGSWVLESDNDFSGSLTVKGGTLYVRDRTKYSWFRLVIKKGVENASDFTLHEIGIYDSDGRRLNGDLLRRDGCSTGDNVWKLPTGACTYQYPYLGQYDGAGAVEFGSYTVKRPVDALFDDGTLLPGAEYSYARFYVSTNGIRVVEGVDDTNSWLCVAMHLASTPNRAASFDVVSNAKSNCPEVFSLEGSVDGRKWTDLTPGNLTVSYKSNGWLKSRGSYTAGSAATHTGGWSISGGPENAVASLSNVSNVSVSAGARLVGENKAVVIRGLVVDVLDAGTIENCTIVENGVLEVRNLPKGEAVLPIAFENCVGVKNLEKWTLVCNGRIRRGRSLSVDDEGRVHILASGLVLTVR